MTMGKRADLAATKLVVADHAPSRLGVRMALGDDVEICAEAGDGAGAVAAADAHRPDVCLLSLDIPGGGSDAIRAICEASPRTAVVVLAAGPDVEDLLSAVRAGAVGFLPGGLSAEALRRIVRGVAANEAAVPRAMVTVLLQALRDGAIDATQGLTMREAQVLGLLQRGLSTGEIADRLQIAPVTVRRHVSRLVRKQGVADRAGLLAPAAETNGA